MAVVEHRGDAYGGHYVCYGRRPGPAGDAEWLLFNDAAVRRAPLAEVHARVASGGRGAGGRRCGVC